MLTFSKPDIRRMARLNVGVRPKDARPHNNRNTLKGGEENDSADDGIEDRVAEALQQAQQAIDLPSVYEAQLPDDIYDDELKKAISELEKLRDELGAGVPKTVLDMLTALQQTLDR